MTYSDGAWGEQAKNRSKSRREYFKKYAKSRRQSTFKPKGCIKRNARQRVRDHILAGKIIKPTKCENCPSTEKLEAHHEDYSQPLKINWLCKSCHVEADKKVKALQK